LYIQTIETETTPMTPCIKCNGTRIITQFGHIEHGKCFRCMGTGRELTKADRIEITAKRAEAADRRLAKSCGLTIDEYRLVQSGRGHEVRPDIYPAPKGA
jgi:hypothetical protein